MFTFLTFITLNMWIIAADFVMTPNINIVEELEKISTLEKRMNSMKIEMEQLKADNAAQAKQLKLLDAQSIITMAKLESAATAEVPKIAFSAALLTTFGPRSVTSASSDLQTLLYKHVFLNIGNAYDPNTGIFTAPVRGVYAFRVFSKAIGNTERAVTAGLFKNDEHIISTHGHQQTGFISSSNGVSLLLEKGDTVKVNLYPGQWIFDNGEHHHSTFSGHLLFLMLF